MPEDDWDQLIGIDLKGYYLCSQAVGKGMVARKKGNIINIASVLGTKTAPGRGTYSVAKAGVIMLTRALAQDLGSYGIRANTIAPGLARTEFGRASWSNPEYLKKIEAAIPLGRIAEPDDIVGAAVFLASDASAYITGTTILIDGGRSA
ncbi:3-oxoacyl-[acyl-carrier-protein] reductase [subsurface metagenome]